MAVPAQHLPQDNGLPCGSAEADTADSAALEQAYQQFSNLSGQLSESYALLEQQVATLKSQLAEVSQQRTRELTEKARLAGRLRNLLDLLPGGVVVLDGRGVVREVNPAARELLGEEAAQYRKVTDVMDVWADSGLSFECVAHTHDDFTAPVELYLEGSDQHRGWFHSSLLMSEALYQRAPYRGVLTHGFTVDEKGRKMSKSLGNVIAPDKVMNSLGADVLRLWVAATDYSGEMSISDEILKRTADSYRRLRNTVRYLLGNLHGFDPARDAVPVVDLLDFDAWALRRARDLHEEVVEAYRNYQFHLVYQRVHNFCVNDLGGLYLDVLKDRMYTTPAEGRARRSAQTAMHHIAQAMVRWLAPILSFTAEEIWQVLPGREAAQKSVFLTTWHEFPSLPAGSIDWEALLQLRAAVQRELEKLREAGSIGAPLQADVDIHAVPGLAGKYRALGDELRFLTITSAARVHEANEPPSGAVPAETGSAVVPGVWLQVRASGGTKCVRCWHLTADIGSDATHPQLCGRCAGNVSGQAEVRRHV